VRRFGRIGEQRLEDLEGVQLFVCPVNSRAEPQWASAGLAALTEVRHLVVPGIDIQGCISANSDCQE